MLHSSQSILGIVSPLVSSSRHCNGCPKVPLPLFCCLINIALSPLNQINFICFSERNTELMRDAIHTRYTLLPYFYTLFREANVTGVPVVRPLWMEFPQDEATFSNDEAFMVGNGLLVQGVYTKVLRALKYHFSLISTFAFLSLYLSNHL